MKNIYIVLLILPIILLAQPINAQNIKDSAFATIHSNIFRVNIVFPAFTLINPGTLVIANYERKLGRKFSVNTNVGMGMSFKKVGGLIQSYTNQHSFICIR
ncbi:hypothetical protein [Hydrotalea flava]|uniref:hypothetical protein n=1 Tax=Hydrotalea flava TaxID=714549 RepID=UPI0008331D57|nr:hypothetical protein [Hydrotalea flava]